MNDRTVRRFAAGSMVLSGERISDGETIVDRITWTGNPDGTVRQKRAVSKDSVETFNTIFDGPYKATNSEAGPGD